MRRTRVWTTAQRLIVTLTATVTTGTSLYGDGDYQLVREVTGKRVGVCPPVAPKQG